MADNSYNIMVSNPVTPFTMARSFKACSNGKIFIGKPDTDPTFPENQIPVYIENECGKTVQVPQPIVINTAGYPVYHGQVAKFVTAQNHSMAVYDSYMVQQFYWGDLSKVDPDSINEIINDLRVKISSPEGSKLSGYRQTDVYQFLSRFGSTKDYGLDKSTYGYDSNFISQYNATRANDGDDDTLLYRGGLIIGRDTYGTGWNSCALSVRANLDIGQLFTPQLGSIAASTADIAAGNGDGAVSIYADAVSMPFMDGEIFNNPIYNSSGFSDVAVPNGLSTGLLKIGSIIKTAHAAPWFGVVSKISGNEVTLREGWWQKGASSASLPTSGAICNANPKRSFWAHNTNLILSTGGRGSAGIAHEYGVRNDSGIVNGVMGIGVWQMPGSSTDSQYGINVGKTSANQKTKFITNYMSSGGVTNYYSHGDKDTQYGIYLDGSHKNGLIMLGIGDSNNSIAIRNEAGYYPSIIMGSGQVQRLGAATVNIGTQNSAAMTPDYQDYHSNFGGQQTVSVSNATGFNLYQRFRKWNSFPTTFTPIGVSFSYGIYSDITSITLSGQCKVEFRLGAAGVIYVLVEAGTVQSFTSSSAGTINS